MENKNILMLRHHPLNVKFTNTFYTGQTENDLSEYTVIDVTSRVERDQSFMTEHPGFGKELSPFFIGPVVAPDGTKASRTPGFSSGGTASTPKRSARRT